MNRYTEQELNWLIINFPKDESRQETYQRFCKEFNNNHSYNSFCSQYKKMKLKKPEYRRCYQKGNKTWSTGLSKEEHRSHFTKESYKKMTDTKLHNFPHIVNRIEYNVPEGYVLSDLGDGEMMQIEEPIYKCMQYFKYLGKGDLTKAVYETYRVKRKLEEIKGKKIRIGTRYNTKEYLDTIRGKGTEKLSKRIIAVRNGEKREFTSLSEASRELGISIGCISRVVNGLRNHTHHYKFYIKESIV